MALKHFVIDPGFPLETIEIPKNTVGIDLEGDGNVRVTRLDTIPDLIGHTLLADINALKAFWNERDATISLSLRVLRHLVNSVAKLKDGMATEENNANPSTIHALSYQYILPPGLSECIHDIVDPSDSSDLSKSRLARDIKFFEVDFTNYQLHDSIDEAAKAYQRWKYAEEASMAKRLASQEYFKIPPTS